MYSIATVFSGDTLYLKFTTDATSADWAYKFTVSGGKVGRFDSGFLILNAVLAHPDGLKFVTPVLIQCTMYGVHGCI